MNILRMLFCNLIVVMNVGIHAMQLTPKQNVMKQKLENEVDIIGKVTEFVARIGNSEFLDQEESEEVKQILSGKDEPEAMPIAALNSITRSLQLYEEYYDKEYRSSSALKKIKDAIDSYTSALLECMHLVADSEDKIYLYLASSLQLRLCSGVEHYLCNEDYNIKAALYKKLSSQELFDDTKRIMTLETINELCECIKTLMNSLEKNNS